MSGRTLRSALRRAQLTVALGAAGLCAGCMIVLGAFAWRTQAIEALPAATQWRLALGGIAGALICTTLGTLGALYLSRRLLRDITEPLHSLANVADAARREHRFERRVPHSEVDDLEQLGSDVNALLDELEHLSAHNQPEPYLQASLDILTGLPNRVFFEARLARNLSDKQPRRMAVLYIDADHFKAINDRHGHAAADEVLICLAGRVRTQLRENDLLARLGGDEFAVLLSPLNDSDDAWRIADNIIAALHAPLVLPNADSLHASISVGVALAPDHGQAATELLAAAADALHQAKRLGRGRWHQAEPTNLAV